MGCSASATTKGSEESVLPASTQTLKVAWQELPDSYQDIEGTQFAEVLRGGCMAVIKASYFKQCLEKGEAFKDRSHIPPEFIYTGEEVVENWKRYGSMFLIILSYSWLSKKHPDPELYHLKRLVQVLELLYKVYTTKDLRGFKAILRVILQRNGNKTTAIILH